MEKAPTQSHLTNTEQAPTQSGLTNMEQAPTQSHLTNIEQAPLFVTLYPKQLACQSWCEGFVPPYPTQTPCPGKSKKLPVTGSIETWLPGFFLCATRHTSGSRENDQFLNPQLQGVKEDQNHIPYIGQKY